jgi:hypothetical protein
MYATIGPALTLRIGCNHIKLHIRGGFYPQIKSIIEGRMLWLTSVVQLLSSPVEHLE